jgi:hypothetical protein
MQMSKLLALIALLGLVPLQASAQDSSVRDDVHCLIVGAKFVSLGDDAHKSAGMMLTIYYFGRLDAHVPKLDVESLLIKEVGTMTPEGYEADVKRCGNNLASKGQEISRIGQDLVQYSQQTHPQSSDSVK